jgi:hypothetical protein
VALAASPPSVRFPERFMRPYWNEFQMNYCGDYEKSRQVVSVDFCDLVARWKEGPPPSGRPPAHTSTPSLENRRLPHLRPQAQPASLAAFHRAASSLPA